MTWRRTGCQNATHAEMLYRRQTSPTLHQNLTISLNTKLPNENDGEILIPTFPMSGSFFDGQITTFGVNYFW